MITARNLTKKWDDVTALSGVTLSVRKGEITGLIGPDGSGKSTFIRLALALAPFDSGELRCMGTPPSENRDNIRRKVGYMPERFSLYPDLSIEENLQFTFRIYGGEHKDYEKKRERLYQFSHLKPFANRRAGQLSGGMKQKLALSCALMHDPELLILDEPTTGVDPLSRREFWTMLAELRDQGMTILVTTPYMDEARLCERIYLMNHGKILAEGNPVEAIKQSSISVIRFISSSTHQEPHEWRPHLQSLFPGTPVYLAGRAIHLSFHSRQETEKALLLLKERYPDEDIKENQPDLEDLFMSRIQEGV